MNHNGELAQAEAKATLRGDLIRQRIQPLLEEAKRSVCNPLCLAA